MKSLAALGNDPTYLSRFEAIRDSKRAPVRPVLIAAHDQIVARYQALLNVANAGELHAIGGSPLLAISAELRSCYGGETKALLALKRAIRDAQPARRLKYCPYCCMTKSDTHDHYMPGSRFPEFAVNGLNLVPCCFKCNTIKDNDWLDNQGRRRYIHFYLDTIPNAEFLKVELLIAPPLVGVAARFFLEQGTIEDGAWSLVERHFARLKLLARYNDDASVEIIEFLEAGATHVRVGGAHLRDFLNLQAANLREVFGRSNWRSVLLSALAAHPDLENWIAEKV